MFSLTHFINRKPQKTFSTINSQVASLDLEYGFLSAKSHRLVYNSSKNFKNFDNISYIATDIHLHDVFVDDSEFKLSFAKYYQNNTSVIKGLVSKIVEDMSNRKALFLNVELGGYGFNEITKYYKHGVSIIFQPDDDCYKGVIINSHGNSINHEIETIISRKRIKTTIYKEGVDVVLMKKLVKIINQNSLQKIKYIGNETDTFLGANLQCSDWRGFCYIYPFILFQYYGEYYESERKLDDCLTIQSSSELLKNGNITKFVHGVFAEFNERFKEKIIEIKNSENKKYLDSLEDVIVSQDYRFIKDIISPYLSFLSQKMFK